MRVADFLKARFDFAEIGRKSRRRKRCNLGAARLHSEPYTPRSLLSCWLRSPTTAAGEGTRLGCLLPFPSSCCKKEEQREEKDEEGFATCSVGAAPPAMVDSVGGNRERKPEALSFNLGMGAALIFLLAKSVTEFNKMTKLRSEMEMMLKHIKGEIQSKAGACSLLESLVNSFPSSDYWGIKSSNKPVCLHDDTESCNFGGEYSAMVSDRHMDLDNKMEPELHVEPQYLQLNMEAQDSSMDPHQDRLEVDCESSGSLKETFEEVKEPKEEANKHCGVCPHELGRRLYELLEARQQEWIAELETASKCRERKFHEREIEICWWRDIARSVSKHREDKLHLLF